MVSTFGIRLTMGLILAKSIESIDFVIGFLSNNLKLTYDNVTKYIGLEITRNRRNRTIKLKQTDYIKQKLIQFRMEDANHLKFQWNQHQNSRKLKSRHPYRQTVGSLLWLSLQTRPDIHKDIDRYNISHQTIEWCLKDGWLW